MMRATEARRGEPRGVGSATMLAIRRAVLFATGALAILGALALGGRDLPGEGPVADGLVSRLVGVALWGADERVILRASTRLP